MCLGEYVFCWRQLSVSPGCAEKSKQFTDAASQQPFFTIFNSWPLTLSAVVRYHHCALRRTEQCSQVEPAVIRPWREMMDTQSSHRQFTPEETIHSPASSGPTPPSCAAAPHSSSSPVGCYGRVITSLHYRS